MTVEQMRLAISQVYNSLSWRRKVSGMTDANVIAVYNDFKLRGKLK